MNVFFVFLEAVVKILISLITGRMSVWVWWTYLQMLLTADAMMPPREAIW